MCERRHRRPSSLCSSPAWGRWGGGALGRSRAVTAELASESCFCLLRCKPTTQTFTLVPGSTSRSNCCVPVGGGRPPCTAASCQTQLVPLSRPHPPALLPPRGLLVGEGEFSARHPPPHCRASREDSTLTSGWLGVMNGGPFLSPKASQPGALSSPSSPDPASPSLLLPPVTEPGAQHSHAQTGLGHASGLTGQTDQAAPLASAGPSGPGLAQRPLHWRQRGRRFPCKPPL